MIQSWLPSGPNILVMGLIRSPYRKAAKDFVEWAERECPQLSPAHVNPEIIKMNTAKFGYMAVVL